MPLHTHPDATPIRRLRHPELTPDVLERQAEPLIVTEWPAPPRSLDLAQLRRWLDGVLLWVYARNTGESWQEWQADAFLDAWSEPDADPGLNVVDVYLEDARYDAVFPVPPAIDAVNLLNRDARTRHYRRSVILTAPGAYTPMHVDAYGCGGWMYLIQGEKQWEVGSAEGAGRLWDAAQGDYADPRRGGWPAGTPTWTGTLRGGEMLIFPPGYIHRVATPVHCVGFGGAFLPAGHAARALEVWHREQQLGTAGELDWADVLHQAAATSPSHAQAAVAHALAAQSTGPGH